MGLQNMEHILKEINIGGGTENMNELLEQITGITYNNLLVAANCLQGQYESLKRLTALFMQLRYLLSSQSKNDNL